MESGNAEDDEESTADKDYDCLYSETGIILEDEEEYDVFNNETFGGPLPDDQNELPSMELQPKWEDYDLHNDETFGEENMEYDWEAEHEKLVEIMEKDTSVDKTDEKKQTFSKKSKISKPNGYLGVDHLSDVFPLVDSSEINKENVFSTNFQKSDRFGDAFSRDNEDFLSDHSSTKDGLLKETKNFCPFTLKSQIEGLENEAISYAQGYSLFASGTNLLQNAGIHIPPVTSANSSPVKPVDHLEKKIDAMKIQSSVNAIPSVSDLEKQWISDAASKPVITADCFRAYNSAFFVNNAFVNNSNSSFASSPVKANLETFSTVTESFREEPNQMVMQLQKMVYSSVPGASVKNENDINGSQFQGKPYTVSMIPNSGVMMYNNIRYQIPSTFTDSNGQVTMNTCVNNNAIGLNRNKMPSLVDPSVLLPSDPTSRLIENPSMLIDGAMSGSNLAALLRNNDTGVGMPVFPPPPPGLTIDPSKIVRVQNTAALQAPPQLSSYLTLPPPQVLNGIITVEQQKQLMKMQKENSISNVDEYAGMMTEREKYWLAGVQLLQINSMDPHKDDYYFTNYQARRKGNRNKNQNQNNSTWKNQHTKDYSPLQFENSLGRVQIGSVVAPRKVIDTYLIESSPKHGKTSELIHEDPIANTSSRKRKAIMLNIENMYGRIMALENLQMNGSKIKTDPATIKAEYINIATALREEILNLKDDLKIIMSIKKGKRLILKFLSFCDDVGDVWFQLFEILDRIIRGDYEHCVLLSYLPYFRAWLSKTDLATAVRIADYFKRNLNFFLQDKFSISVIANMIEHAELVYFVGSPEDQSKWMDFVMCLAEKAHSSVESIERPVVSVKPQVLRSHLLKCKKLENDVSFFGQLSQVSIGCINFRLDVSVFGWMSQFSDGCLNFRLDVSIFG
ncbi:hypothetical protein V9T40_014057 [Parthenolecanium corni]|uniref:Uncharacterized protein n=1 Tax=Parthenolecanium corni TaxID=536013 RepID=A0AAN9Y1V5_9HEMI